MRNLKAVLSHRLLAVFTACAVCLALSGCGALTQNNWSATFPASSDTVAGIVHAGQAPVVGGKLYLYAAATTGYNVASTSLLTSAVLTNNVGATGYGTGGFDGTNYYVATDATGAFNITSDWTCTAGTDIYFLLVGGNPGGYGTNPNLMLMAALGNCSTVPSFTFMNEVSTVASVYGLSGFMSSPTQVSSANTTASKAGMAAAFATVPNIETISTGAALAATPGSNGTVTSIAPQSNINTLASILAVCENSAGGVAGDSSVCGTLFSDTTKSGGISPTNTLQAAINIAHNAGTVATTLYNDLMPGAPAFSPTLSTAPNDWTMPIVFYGGGMNNLYDIAIDGNNNVWAVSDGKNGDCPVLSASTGSDVVELTNLGVAKSGSAGYTNTDIACPYSIAIDTSNQGWVTNDYVNYIDKLTTAGAVTGYQKTTANYTDYPDALAFDASGNIWIDNFSNAYLLKYSVSGNSWTSYSGASGGMTVGASGHKESWGIAVNGSSVYVVSNDTTGQLDKFTTAGVAVTTSSGYTGGGIAYPLRLALDQGGNIWVSNIGASATTSPGTTLSEFSSTGTALSPSAGFTGGGLDAPFGIAVDGGNHIWVANGAACGVSEFDDSGNVLSPSIAFTGTVANTCAGYTTQGTNAMVLPEAVAIDEAGNVWVANYGVNTGTGVGTTAQTLAGSITELVGAGTPTLTPLAAATVAGTPAAMP